MPKCLKGTNFTIYPTTLGLQNQEMQNFLRMTYSMGVINPRAQFLRKINLSPQVKGQLSFTTPSSSNVEQPIVEFPQATKNNPVDQIVQEMPEIVEQLIEQHDPQENVDSTLMRFTRARKLAILSDYVMYIQESNYNIEPKMILKIFHKP